MLGVLFALLARGKGTITKSAKRVEKNEFLICLKIKKIMGFPSALNSKKKLGTFDCDNVVFYGMYFHCRRFSMLMWVFLYEHMPFYVKVIYLIKCCSYFI